MEPWQTKEYGSDYEPGWIVLLPTGTPLLVFGDNARTYARQIAASSLLLETCQAAHKWLIEMCLPCYYVNAEEQEQVQAICNDLATAIAAGTGDTTQEETD